MAYQYYLKTDSLEPIESELYDSLRSIFTAYQKGTSSSIYAHKDGLIYSGNSSTNTSWIPLTENNGDILRYGKLLEINALWYNAAKILEQFSLRLGKKRMAGKFKKTAEKTASSFLKVFYDDKKGVFFDFVNNKTKNTDFRINQAVPLSLSFCVIDEDKSQELLGDIEEKLVTPYGLKSQDKHIDQNGKIITKSKPAYYCGAVWPWTIYLYIQAGLKLKADKEQFSSYMLDYLKPFYELMDEGLLGYLPEIIESNGKPEQKGIDDYTPSMAALVWAEHILKGTKK